MATTKSEAAAASLLQTGLKVMRIGFITVGLLAMFGLAGCGVGGAEDVEGQQAVAVTQQQRALHVGEAQVGTPMANITGPSGDGRPSPGESSLPQDPVPYHNPSPGLAVVPSN